MPGDMIPESVGEIIPEWVGDMDRNQQPNSPLSTMGLRTLYSARASMDVLPKQMAAIITG